MRGSSGFTWKRSVSALIAAGVVLSGVVAAPSTASAQRRPTVLQILQSDAAKDGPAGLDHRWYDYDIFTTLMLSFDYERALLVDPDQALTLFAPKDYAFFRLAKQLGAPPAGEAATLDWLLTNLGAGPIEDALLVHIHLGTLSFAEIRASDGAELDGGALVDVRRAGRVRLIDLDPNDRDPYIIQPEYGGRAANGYVHGIGRVMRPFDLP